MYAKQGSRRKHGEEERRRQEERSEEEQRGLSTGLKDYRPLPLISHPRGERDDDVTLGSQSSQKHTHMHTHSHETASVP